MFSCKKTQIPNTAGIFPPEQNCSKIHSVDSWSQGGICHLLDPSSTFIPASARLEENSGTVQSHHPQQNPSITTNLAEIRSAEVLIMLKQKLDCYFQNNETSVKQNPGLGKGLKK